ncbi:RAF-like serine/threonine-protein kinase PRAF, partial [Bidens hawaiensis]|uniref:RAF-like serine/threonine-protein kinase PRAF n=1 Tax=Bidens hawaiensis TaxID=980011 RepID=UPI00404B8504
MAGASLTPSKSPTTETIKLLCSYGGRILPRYPDGKLRYYGGQTRVLAVARSISFSELMIKLGELCGKTVSLRCQLPTEDLDTLVRIMSDEDLANLVEEYDRTPIKIRAFLSTSKKCSSSTASVSDSGSGSGSSSSTNSLATTPKLPFYYNKSAGKLPCYAYRDLNRCCLVPNGNYWQHSS